MKNKKPYNRKSYSVHLSNETINRIKFIKAISKNKFDIGLFLEKTLSPILYKAETKLKIDKETWKKARKCERCNSYMIVKEGKNGKFYGCCNYPECKNTDSLDNV